MPRLHLAAGALAVTAALAVPDAASAATVPTTSAAGIGSIPMTSQSTNALMLQLAQQRAAALDQKIKSQLAGGAGTSQLDMLRLQAMVSKQNQTFEMMSNLVQKFSGTRDTIIGNIR